MTQMQGWVGNTTWRRSRDLKLVVEEGGGKSRRPVLMSSSDQRRLTAERDRVRQLGSARPHASNMSIPFKDISNSQAPTKDMDSMDEFTAHTINSILHRNSVVPVYPTIVVGKSDWCDRPPCNIPKQNLQYRCKCATCTTASCPSKVPPRTPSTEKACPFKDNIIRFCDQYTMTPKLTDACCGKAVTYVPSDTDTQACPSVGTHKICTRDSYIKLPPPPILKRTEECYYDCSPDHHNQRDMQQQQGPVRHTEMGEYYCEPKPQYKCFIRPHCKHMGPFEYAEPTPCVEGVESNRRILYNEGIDDTIVWTPDSTCKRRSKPSCAIKSRNKNRLCVNIDNYIPHSHMGTSKYHDNCKKSHMLEPRFKMDLCSSRESLQPSDCREVMDCRDPHPCPRKTWYIKHPSCGQPCSYYPRKVLPSEKGVERFMKPDRVCSRQYK